MTPEQDPISERVEKSAEGSAVSNITTPNQLSGIGESVSTINESEKFSILVQSAKPRAESKNKFRVKTPSSTNKSMSNRENFRVQNSMRSTASSTRRSHDEYQLREIKKVIKNAEVAPNSGSQSKEGSEYELSKGKRQKSSNKSCTLTENTLLHLPQLPKIHDSDLKRFMAPTMSNNKASKNFYSQVFVPNPLPLKHRIIKYDKACIRQKQSFLRSSSSSDE